MRRRPARQPEKAPATALARRGSGIVFRVPSFACRQHFLEARDGTYPSLTLFAAIFRYFASLSIPMTPDSPLSNPAANVVPEPTNGSSNTPAGDRMYVAYQSVTT